MGRPWSDAQRAKYQATRKRMREEQEKGDRHERSKNGRKVSNSARKQSIEGHVAYAFGHIEAWLQFYADGAGISRAALTGGVVELLRRKARREVLGS